MAAALAIALAAGLAGSAAPATRAGLVAALDAHEPAVAAAFARTKAPGLAIGVVSGGELIWFRAYGVRDVDARAPVDEQSVFRIASMSKAFVSAAVLRLRDEGKLALDEPAEKYLPELKGLAYPTRDSPRITVRHLISHAAGLPEDNASADLRMPMSEADFAAVLKRGLSFANAPGTHFEYSNLGFALAGRLVTRVAGERLQEYVSKQLLAPLGMAATGWDAKAVPEAHRVRGYGRKSSPMPSSGLTKYDDDLFHEEPALADGSWAPIGGLWTSPRDYAKWVALQLAAWPPRDEAERGPVRRSSLREAQTIQRPSAMVLGRDPHGAFFANAAGYGLGWGVSQTCDFDHVATHGGGLPGYGSYVMLLPEYGVGAFAMTNLTYTSGATAVRDLLELLARKKLIAPRTPPLSPQLVAARDGVLQLYEKFDEAALKKLADWTYLVYQPAARVQKQLASLRLRHGACRAGEPVEVENALRGKLGLACEHGKVELEVTLTSEVPATIQSMDLQSILPPSDELKDAAGAAAALVGHWDEAHAELLLAPAADRTEIREGLGRLRAIAGRCRLGEEKRGDGATSAVFKLACDRGEAELTLALAEGGKLSKLSVHELQAGRCPR